MAVWLRVLERETSCTRNSLQWGLFSLHWVPEYDYLRMNLELNNGKEGLGYLDFGIEVPGV